MVHSIFLYVRTYHVRMCMCVCGCACMYVCMHACMHLCMCVCMCEYLLFHVWYIVVSILSHLAKVTERSAEAAAALAQASRGHLCALAAARVPKRLKGCSIFMYVCMYACMHACMYVCMYVYMYVLWSVRIRAVGRCCTVGCYRVSDDSTSSPNVLQSEKFPLNILNSMSWWTQRFAASPTQGVGTFLYEMVFACLRYTWRGGFNQKVSAYFYI